VSDGELVKLVTWDERIAALKRRATSLERSAAEASAAGNSKLAEQLREDADGIRALLEVFGEAS